MIEITREQFWELENRVADCSIQRITNELIVERNGEGRLYKNKGLAGKKWFRSIPEQNVYLADAKLIQEFLK